MKVKIKTQKQTESIPDTEKSSPNKKKCFWPWDHDWSMWKTTNEGNIVRHRLWVTNSIDREALIGKFKVQERTCITCGRSELNTLESTIEDYL